MTKSEARALRKQGLLDHPHGAVASKRTLKRLRERQRQAARAEAAGVRP